MTHDPSITRRGLLKTSVAGAAAFVAAPTILSSRLFGADAPSNKIVMGAIGVGSMGSGNLGGFLGDGRVQVVAVCDVDKGHVDGARNRVNGQYHNQDCRAYEDFREMIAKEKLDAVSLALPDHWHALIAVACAKAGWDIYGEKPLARSIREGRAICDAVSRYGRIWQTGSWQRSQGHFRQAAELVRNGVLGKIQRVEVGLPGGSSSGRVAPSPPPPGLNYNFWLGPAPWREHCHFQGQGSVHWHWRWIMDYSGGQLTDWAGHHIDIAHWGLGKDADGPVEIAGKGEYPADGLYDAPYGYRFTCTYADGLPLIVGDGGKVPDGAKWFGEKGWIHVNRGGLWASDPKILQEKIGPDGVRLYVSNNHHQNFLDCVRSRQATVTPAETAHRSISVALLGEIAMLTGRKIKWNPKTEEIVGDAGASALLGRPYREPWTL
ncbi:MAG: Gfo/Idh/MocA family oxidoreductase [Planctomycetota bacterium]|nr:Gfo/Idh/MocA family oxidoreductase [Planctomycetota bacterium]